MKSFLILIGVALVAAAGFVGGLAYRAHRDSAGKGISAQKPQRHILYYVDPMHPAYKSDKPGIAPDCGMKLEPVYADSAVPESAGTGTLNISPEQQRLIGVQYGQAELTTSSNPFRASGKVALDETRLVRVHPKVEGWIEKVFVDFTGAPIEKGQQLLTIYSPDMLAAEQDYLLAIQARKILRSSPLAEAAQNSDSLLKASRTRLELWDLSPAQMDEIERTGNTIHAITLYAPAGGFVMTRNAFPSQKVTPDTQLYEIGDLSRVWIMADVFESDAANIRMGQAASVTTAYRNGMKLAARVSFIQPQVDAATRTMKVRLEAPNPGFQLKPDMFVDIEFQVASQRRLTVPAEAVLDAGIRKTVFVDLGNGHLEPRQVEIGERLGDRIEILGGLKPGERIVTSGNFLIDSESQLKQALQGSTDSGEPQGARPSAKTPAHPPGHQHD
jgi:Cu(I)/Ag(I) efflux system membrane fusion protein